MPSWAALPESLKRALILGTGGAALGGLTGYGISRATEGPFDKNTRARDAATGAFLGGTLGAGLGAHTAKYPDQDMLGRDIAEAFTPPRNWPFGKFKDTPAEEIARDAAAQAIQTERDRFRIDLSDAIERAKQPRGPEILDQILTQEGKDRKALVKRLMSDDPSGDWSPSEDRQFRAQQRKKTGSQTMNPHLRTAYEYGVKQAMERYGMTKEAMRFSSALGAVPGYGPVLSGLSAGISDDSVGQGLRTGLGSAAGQLGGGIGGGLLGGLAGYGLGSALDDEELAAQLAALGGGIGGLGGAIAGGGLGAAKGRDMAH